MGFPVPGDIELSADGRELLVVEGRAKIAQSIKTRAQIFKGSWRYDRALGVPYFEDILVAGRSVELVRRRFHELIAGTDGVTGVTGLALTFDSATETISVKFDCTTVFGTVSDTLSLAAVA